MTAGSTREEEVRGFISVVLEHGELNENRELAEAFETRGWEAENRPVRVGPV